MCEQNLVVMSLILVIAVFDCERAESCYSLLPKYIGFGLQVMKGVFSSKILSTGIFSVI